jgi:hypothetical protein
MNLSNRISCVDWFLDTSCDLATFVHDITWQLKRSNPAWTRSASFGSKSVSKVIRVSDLTWVVWFNISFARTLVVARTLGQAKLSHFVLLSDPKRPELAETASLEGNLDTSPPTESAAVFGPVGRRGLQPLCGTYRHSRHGFHSLTLKTITLLFL